MTVDDRHWGWCPALLALALLLLLSGRAEASPGRVLVLPLSGEVSGAPGATARLTQVVGRAAGLTGAEVIMGEATFADAAIMVGCAEETVPCLAMLAEALNVDHVVIGSVTVPPEGAGPVVVVKVFLDGALEERSYDLPGDEVDAMVHALARDLPGLFLRGPEPAPPEPAPESAADAGAGAAADQAAAMPREPPPPAAEDSGEGRGGRGWTPWLVTAGGVVLAGSGAGFLWMARDRQRAVNEAPLRDLDDFRRVTALEDQGDRYMKIGNGLLIGGGVVMAAGVVLIVVQGRSAPDQKVSLTPVPVAGGAAVALTVRIP